MWRDKLGRFRANFSAILARRAGNNSGTLNSRIAVRQGSAAAVRGVLREVPVVHKTTWLEALKAREKFLAENPDKKDQFTFSTHDVHSREVTSRTPQDSFTTVLLPFKDDKWALDSFTNAFGRLRIGQLFQDLDRLSGIIANKHCEPAEPVIVTASVDRILMLKRLPDLSEHNLLLWGSVTWTGRSSMEITIHACTTAMSAEEYYNKGGHTLEEARGEEAFMIANFTFVARDPKTQKAFPVNHLKPESQQELHEFVLAERYNQRKKAEAQKNALTVRQPSLEESQLIHTLWLEQLPGHKQTHKNFVSMSDTRVYSTSVMQPQRRNRHSYMIFGGVMMRETFELAYACAGAFARSPPRFVALDTVTFRSPVPVGSVLHLTAFVTYTEKYHRHIDVVDGKPAENKEGLLIQVRVESEVRGLINDIHRDAGTFVYSFFVDKVDLQMLPTSYAEMMQYLEGRRGVLASEEYLQDVSH